MIKGAFHTVSCFQTPDTLINFKLLHISEDDEVAFSFVSALHLTFSPGPGSSLTLSKPHVLFLRLPLPTSASFLSVGFNVNVIP